MGMVNPNILPPFGVPMIFASILRGRCAHPPPIALNRPGSVASFLHRTSYEARGSNPSDSLGV